MLWRALLVLILVLALSVAATWAFGESVLIALGLIAIKLKILAKAVAATPVGTYVAWAKAQATAFLRVEFIKAWVTSSVVPLIVGRAVLRRIQNWIGRYLDAVKVRHAQLKAWYRELGTAEKIVSGAILLAVTLALSVTTLGLWLILFSVQVPLWLAALGAALGRMVWESVQKSAFKALAWMQLGWLWAGVKRLVPARWLGAKRRVNMRLARAVIRRRRLTVAELSARKDSLPFRLGVLVEMLWGGRG